MTSLTEVYDGTAPEVTSRRLYAGTAFVVLGAALAVVAVLVATTDFVGGYAVELSGEMAAQFATVRAAGVLAGLSVPIILVGVFVVLPAGRRVQAAAAISASLCLLGVALFWHAYPAHWRYGGDQLTLEVSVVYLLGLLTAVWCLFTAVATFKRRNDPGGALQMNVTRHNKTVIESDESDSGGLGASDSSAARRTETWRRRPTPTPTRAGRRSPTGKRSGRPRRDSRRVERGRPAEGEPAHLPADPSALRPATAGPLPRTSPRRSSRATAPTRRSSSRRPSSRTNRRIATVGTARTSSTSVPRMGWSPTAPATKRRWTTWTPARSGRRTDSNRKAKAVQNESSARFSRLSFFSAVLPLYACPSVITNG